MSNDFSISKTDVPTAKMFLSLIGCSGTSIGIINLAFIEFNSGCLTKSPYRFNIGPYGAYGPFHFIVYFILYLKRNLT